MSGAYGYPPQWARIAAERLLQPPTDVATVLFEIRWSRCEEITSQLYFVVDIPYRCWPDGPSALGLAALRGALPLARLLLDRGADVNFVWGRSTPLLAACDRGHEEMAKLLIERGADTTYRSIQGATVLMHAATSNNVQLTRSILSLQAVGIDERSTSRGQSAFFSACFYGAADTARWVPKSRDRRPGYSRVSGTTVSPGVAGFG